MNKMSLENYRKKREFEKTNEPEGKINKKTKNKRIFVVHDHRARTHHYDLRLEDEGVLKSWAITKIPPKGEGTKRLAIEVDKLTLSKHLTER